MAYQRRETRRRNPVQPRSKIEVGDDKFEVFINKKIFRFDVPMYKTTVMQLTQALQQLLKQVPYQIVTHPLVNFHKSVQLSVLRETHNVEADRVLALQDAAII